MFSNLFELHEFFDLSFPPADGYTCERSDLMNAAKKQNAGE